MHGYRLEPLCTCARKSQFSGELNIASLHGDGDDAIFRHPKRCQCVDEQPNGNKFTGFWLKLLLCKQGLIFSSMPKHRSEELKEDMLLNKGMRFHNTVQCQIVQNYTVFCVCCNNA